jgi:lipopolysaccharide biosynthesis regulator YciM
VPIRLALVVLLVAGGAVAYLASLGSGRVAIPLGPGLSWAAPLWILAAGAFAAGAALAIALGLVRNRSRGVHDARALRGEEASATSAELYRLGEDAAVAGRPAAAVAVFEALLRGEPGHAAAHARLGELARARGDDAGALRHFLQAMRVDERPEIMLAAADAYGRVGRLDDAVALYADVIARTPGHLTALRALRDLTASAGRWADAVAAQERLVGAAEPRERAGAQAELAGLHYEHGRGRAAAGDSDGAISAFRDALRVQPEFVPAAIALGDAHLATGDAAQAVKVWERAAEAQPALPLLSRIERQRREEGRPTRMIALYQAAVSRAPDNLAVALALGRVYFDLHMLDEAAEQLEKIEVRLPDLPVIHAYLGAVFERRGQDRQALEEYRRALRALSSFEWPHRCAACGAEHAGWADRCPSCRRWNSLRP